MPSTRLIQWHQDNNPAQEWSVVYGPGGYKLVNRVSRLVMTPDAHSSTGAQLILWHDDGNTDQWWSMKSGEQGITKDIIVDSDGLVVDDGLNFSGIVNRTNSNFWANLYDDSPREDRALDLMLQLRAEGRLNHRAMMQIVAKDIAVSEYNLPYYPNLTNLDPGSSTQQSTFHTISRFCTNLAFVVDGVAPGDNPMLSTIWVNLGEPSVGVAVPFFPAADSISELMYMDSSYFNILSWSNVKINVAPTCYINKAITNVRDSLYDNHTNITLPLAIIILLPNVPATVLGEFAKYEKMLDTASPEQWSAYEQRLIDWHMSFLSSMSGNDTADKTIHVPGLVQVQNWSVPLENMIYDMTEVYKNE
jgi:hypothetical protein